MKSFLLSLLFFIFLSSAFSQNSLKSKEISINGFRNPSIGLEYRQQLLSVHAGYYVTNFTSGVTTAFLKAGVTCWFFPIDKKPIPSSFYAGASYMRGISKEYKNENAAGLEAGFRWMIWKGINIRLGGIAVIAKGKDVKFNPTPGISYSFKLQ